MTKKRKSYRIKIATQIALTAALALVMMGVFTLAYLSAPTHILKMDLRQWDRFPGAVVEGGQVHIHGIDRRIVNQDGSGGVHNPPVNVMGSHLAVSGDFQVSIGTINAASGGAKVSLYGDVPGIYDEWRHEGRSVQVATLPDSLEVTVWDGHSPTPITQEFKTAVPSSTTLRISHQGSQLHFSVNGREVGAVHDPGVSGSHNLWLGADSTAGDGWSIASIEASGMGWGRVNIVPAPTQVVTHSDPSALRNLAGSSMSIGTAVSLYTLMSDPKYRALAIGQFNSWTPENEMKAQFIHPGPGTYAFADADSLVDMALANGILVHGHALVFSEANPKWMQDAPVTDRAAIMASHISNVATHYRGKVKEWDVLNEPLSDDDADYKGGKLGLRHNIWYQAMGESYIDQAFRTARVADPGAKLYINEYGLEQDGDRWDAMIALVKRLKSQGVPIDGVGFQAHIHEESDQVDPDVLRSHFQELNNLGLKVRVSELDVHGDDAAVQAEQYADVLSACRTMPNCTSWSTWGFTDLHGSTSTYTYPAEYGDDLLWSSTYRPKRAYSAVVNQLRQPGQSSAR